RSVPQTGTFKTQVERLEIRLEPDDGKLSSPVLRGGAGSDTQSLPDESDKLNGTAVKDSMKQEANISLLR
ncbi:hypothetical protein ACE1CI_30390, partial [Aerosakkonemataceae cyanobacterium BLCC-F50]